MYDTRMTDEDDLPAVEVRAASAEEIIGFAFDDAVGLQTMANRFAAQQIFAVHEAFEIARENPRIYVPVGASSRSPGVNDLDFAERSVAFDLAQRLHLSENLVRDYDHQAGMLAGSLPRLCELFLSGCISPQHVRAAVDSAAGILSGETMSTYDERLSLVVKDLAPGSSPVGAACSGSVCVTTPSRSGMISLGRSGAWSSSRQRMRWDGCTSTLR